MTDTDNPPPAPTPAAKCPHCQHPQLVQIRNSEIVAIYKCPNCGELVAPVKHERR